MSSFKQGDRAIPTAHHVSVSPSGTHLCRYPHRTDRRGVHRQRNPPGNRSVGDPFNLAFPIGIGFSLTDRPSSAIRSAREVPPAPPSTPHGLERRGVLLGGASGPRRAAPLPADPGGPPAVVHAGRDRVPGDVRLPPGARPPPSSTSCFTLASGSEPPSVHRLRERANPGSRSDLRPPCDSAIGTSPKFSRIPRIATLPIENAGFSGRGIRRAEPGRNTGRGTCPTCGFLSRLPHY